MGRLKSLFQLYQRKPDGPYWVRFSIKGQGQIRVKLETTDPIEAQHKATLIWSGATTDAKNGVSVRKRPVATVVEDGACNSMRRSPGAPASPPRPSGPRVLPGATSPSSGTKSPSTPSTNRRSPAFGSGATTTG